MKADFDNEQGAVAVLIALLLVVLLGSAALVIDIGRIYAEKAQLQNAADAAALSLAKSCAEDPVGAVCSAPTLHAAELAEANTTDGSARIIEANTSVKNLVKVTAGTRDATGQDSFPFLLAPVLGISESDVHASATVAAGGIAAGPAAFPLAFSECQFGLSMGIQLIVSKDNEPIPGCTSAGGHVIPGGFGYLKPQNASQCDVFVQVVAGSGIPSATGNDSPSVCKALLESWLKALQKPDGEVVVLLPVFDEVEGAVGAGEGGKYLVREFAAFSVKGWKFSGGNWNSSQPSKDPYVYKNAQFPGEECKDPCRGIIGKFIRFASLDEDFDLGGPSELGASLIYFSE